MTTNFRAQIQQIRDQEQSRERIPLTDDELGLNDGSEECIQARDELAAMIERLMEDFSRECDGFSVSYGFFEGKYSISLSCDELRLNDRGELDKCFSRINFFLSPWDERRQMEETTKLTVMNRDLPKGSHQETLDAAGLEKFRQFSEEEMLRFAQAYFHARSGSTPPATVS